MTEINNTDQADHASQLSHLYHAADDIIKDMENEDENLKTLADAMEFFCDTFDKAVGYKHAILMTMEDQYENHPHEQDLDGWQRLIDILTGVEVVDQKCMFRHSSGVIAWSFDNLCEYSDEWTLIQ